jgi:hypothetical protein
MFFGLFKKKQQKSGHCGGSEGELYFFKPVHKCELNTRGYCKDPKCVHAYVEQQI